MRAVRPSWAYRFNAEIEDHAEHEYAQFAAEHPEWDATPFHSLAAPEYGSYDSLADVLRPCGAAEGAPRRLPLARRARSPRVGPSRPPRSGRPADSGRSPNGMDSSPAG